ncbi:MAG: hypothetical protein IPM82_11995 [Saprospiraceae bacterium]|nr:hypothetical protein [Saprospiraceae bacterium]
MGGGGYDRSTTIIRKADKAITYNGRLNIQEALDAIKKELTKLQESDTSNTEAYGVVEIQDNSYYFENPRH